MELDRKCCAYCTIAFMTMLTLLIGATTIASLSAAAPLYDDYYVEMDQLQQEALNYAFRKHMVHLFDIWMQDTYDQPQRMLAGAARLREAYRQIKIELDKRSKK